MSDRDTKARQLCEAGLKLMWQGEVEPALEKYTKALELAKDEELRELITIRKAEALIAAGLEGTEVSMLTQIVMRRRTPRHVYIAGMALMRRFVESNDLHRGIFYGEISRQAAEELGDPMARASVLNGLGITLAAKSDFAGALDALEEAFDALMTLDENRPDVRSLRPVILASIGGVKVVNGETKEGIRILEQALPFLDEDYLIAEAMLDLCIGYCDLEDYETADAFGSRGLDLATVPRQVRNGNYLLARIALAQGRDDEASDFIDVVASYYPEYPAVKELLMKVDLSAAVNWKA
jgi:tetratricopeptide (TPR) repeat protein